MDIASGGAPKNGAARKHHGEPRLKYKFGRLTPGDLADVECLWHEWEFFAGLRSSGVDPRRETVMDAPAKCDACGGSGLTAAPARQRQDAGPTAPIMTIAAPQCGECLGGGHARITADLKCGAMRGSGRYGVRIMPALGADAQSEVRSRYGGGRDGSTVRYLTEQHAAVDDNQTKLAEWIVRTQPLFMKPPALASRLRARRAYRALSTMLTRANGARHTYVLYRCYGPKPAGSKWDPTYGGGVLDEDVAPIVDLTDCIEEVRQQIAASEAVVRAEAYEATHQDTSVVRRRGEYARFADGVVTSRDAVRLLIARMVAPMRAVESKRDAAKLVARASAEGERMLVAACNAYRLARATG
jgi:hypothetical protein